MNDVRRDAPGVWYVLVLLGCLAGLGCGLGKAHPADHQLPFESDLSRFVDYPTCCEWYRASKSFVAALREKEKAQPLNGWCHLRAAAEPHMNALRFLKAAHETKGRERRENLSWVHFYAGDWAYATGQLMIVPYEMLPASDP